MVKYQIFNCTKDTRIKKKRTGMAILFKTMSDLILLSPSTAILGHFQCDQI